MRGAGCGDVRKWVTTLVSRAPRRGPVHAKHAKPAEGVAAVALLPEKRDMPQSVQGVCPRKRERSPRPQRPEMALARDPEAIPDPLARPFGEGRLGCGPGFGRRPTVHRRRTSPRGLAGPTLASRDGSEPARDLTHRAKGCPAARRAPGPTAGCNSQGNAARDLIRGEARNPGEGLPSHAQDRKVPREPAPGYHLPPVFGRNGDGDVAGTKPPQGRLDGSGVPEPTGLVV